MVFRPDSASASATPPVMPAVGTEGYYTDGAPPSVPPTTVDAWYLHMLTEEIRNVVTGAGIMPNKALVNQQLQAIKRICAANRIEISSDGTLVPDQAGLVVVDASAGPLTFTLPAAAAANGLPLEFIFTRIDATANVVTVQDAGSDTDAPGGETSATVSPGSPLWLSGDGVSKWDVVFSGAGFLTAAAATADFAAINGSPGQIFNVAPATTATEAPQAQQVVAGNGATWTDVTASRAIGTLYTNSGTKPLLVSIFNNTQGSQNFSFLVEGVQRAGGMSGSTVTKGGTITGVVPIGQTYELTGTGGINSWSEM